MAQFNPKLVDRDFDASSMRGHNGGEGEPPMTAYVTHVEFRAAMDRIDARFDATATKTDLLDVKNGLMAEIHKGVVETQRWMIATVIGLFIGFGGLFLAMTNALKPTPAAAVAQDRPPIIINVPPAAPPAEK